MKKRVLVLGGTGRLGHAVIAELSKRGRGFNAPSRLEWNLADHATLPELIDSEQPSAVLHLAGFTDVNAAEKPENRKMAEALNAEAPGLLAGACARLGIPFVHVSTDYVFDGKRTTPYREDDATGPLQIYGITKEKGERDVLIWPRSLVLRVSTLYGKSSHGRPAYVDAILHHAKAKAAKGGGEVEVVEHPVSSPTYAVDVAPVLLDLLDLGATGVVHTVNGGEASRLELAQAAVEEAGLAPKVTIATREEPAGALMRPAYSVLGTAKLQKLLGRGLPHWRDALARYIADGERA